MTVDWTECYLTGFDSCMYWILRTCLCAAYGCLCFKSNQSNDDHLCPYNKRIVRILRWKRHHVVQHSTAFVSTFECVCDGLSQTLSLSTYVNSVNNYNWSFFAILLWFNFPLYRTHMKHMINRYSFQTIFSEMMNTFLGIGFDKHMDVCLCDCIIEAAIFL